MKKLLLLLFMLFGSNAFACTGYVVGFKGLNDAFDHKAFNRYAKQIGFCGKVFSWHQDKQAVEFINQLKIPYQMYGFSRGAATITDVLKQPLKTKPVFVITIGAYKTADVNFQKYQVKFANYFDQSGVGQKSPGMFINVSHFEMQEKVNQLLWCS